MSVFVADGTVDSNVSKRTVSVLKESVVERSVVKLS
jgi:hypothetical protein